MIILGQQVETNSWAWWKCGHSIHQEPYNFFDAEDWPTYWDWETILVIFKECKILCLKPFPSSQFCFTFDSDLWSGPVMLWVISPLFTSPALSHTTSPLYTGPQPLWLPSSLGPLLCSSLWISLWLVSSLSRGLILNDTSSLTALYT